MKSPPRIPLLLIAAALSLAQANAATISKSSGSTTPTLSEFNAQFSGHPRKVGYGENSPNGMFLETFRMECGRAGVAKAQLEVRLTKLTQGASRGDNDALALWSGGNQAFSTYVWKATDPAGASKALSLDLSALPTNAATGVITAPPGGNGLGLLSAGTLSFSVQDDTRVTAATLTYDCARPRAEGNAVMDPPGHVLARPVVVPGTSIVATSPSTITSSTITKTSTASTVTAPNGTLTWVINVNNQQGNNVPVTVNDPAPAGSTINVGSVQAPPGWNSSATTTTNLQVTGTMGSNSNSFTFPFTPPGSAAVTGAQTNGDGYRPFLHGNNVYALFHHTSNSRLLYCADATTGIACPGSPWGISTTVGAPVASAPTGANDFRTTNLYPEQITGGRVYFFARTVAGLSKPVVVCVDLNTAKTCGYHVYATPTGMTDSLLNGAAWAGRLYAHSGNGNYLCFDTTLATPAPCAPVNTAVSGGAAVSNIRLQIGSKLINWVTNTKIGCLDMATNSACLGFPITPAAAAPSALFPIASLSVPTGFCTPWSTSATPECWTTAGAPITGLIPASLLALVKPNEPWLPTVTGTAVLYGDRTLWVSDFPGPPSKRCVQWNASGVATACAGWAPTPAPATFEFYEAVSDPNRDSCIWALGDEGQLASFSSTTGGPCGVGVKTAIASAAVIPNLFYCDGKPHAFAWGPASISGLVFGTDYTAGNLTVWDAGGSTQLAGPINITSGTVTLPPGLPSSGIVVKVKLTFTPAGLIKINSGQGRVTVNWTADAPQICFTTTVGCSTSGTITNVATASFGTATPPASTTNVTSNPASVSVVNRPDCEGSPPVGCCPGYIAANNLLSMSAHYSAAGGNVTEEILTSSAQFAALVTGMQAHLKMVQLSPTCSAVAKIKLSFTHWSTNSPSAPPPFTGTTGWTSQGQFSISVPAAGTPSAAYGNIGSALPAGSTKFVFAGSPNYYVILASAQVLDLSDQPLKCPDFDGNCFNSLRFRDIYNPAVFRVAAPAGGAPSATPRTTARSF